MNKERKSIYEEDMKGFNYPPTKKQVSSINEINKPVVSQNAQISKTQLLQINSLLELLAPEKSQAVILLGEKLVKDYGVKGSLEGYKLALELIHKEDNSFFQTLATLLADGWSGNLGDLLQCAKTV